jgi:hypothetical protein
MVGPRQTLLEQSIDLLNNALENGDCDVLVDIDPALFDPEYLTEESEALVERMLVSEYDCFRSWVWDNIEDTNITSIPVMFGTQNLDLWQDIKDRVPQDQLVENITEYLANQRVDQVFLEQLQLQDLGLDWVVLQS